MALVSDIISEAFADLGVIQPGEAVSPTIQTAAFLVLQQMWMQWTNDETLAIQPASATGAMSAGASVYLFGSGGLWSVLNPLKLLDWVATDALGNFRNGGKIISLTEFRELSKNPTGRSSVIPEYVACDLGNVRSTTGSSQFFNVFVFPTPSVSGSLLTIECLVRPNQFATVGDTLGLPEGYEAALHYNLAIALAPQYARQGGVPEVLAINAQNAKQFIQDRNAKILGLINTQPTATPAAQ